MGVESAGRLQIPIIDGGATSHKKKIAQKDSLVLDKLQIQT